MIGIGNKLIIPSSGGTLKEGLVSLYEFDDNVSSNGAADSMGYLDLVDEYGSITKEVDVSSELLLNKGFTFSDGFLGHPTTENADEFIVSDGYSISFWFSGLRFLYRLEGGLTIIFFGRHQKGFFETFQFSFQIEGAGAFQINYLTQGLYLTWNHIVIIFDRYAEDGIRAKGFLNNSYLDGVNGVDGPTRSVTPTKFFLGDINNEGSNATIPQFGFWNRVLSLEEIDLLYNNGQGLHFLNW